NGALVGPAAAPLVPIDWPEPFGLAVIEALACGTPIIARPRGSVPEIVSDGRTGFLCETEKAMAAAAARLPSLSRAACRREFEERFSVRAMVAAYERVYESERLRASTARAEKPQRVSVPAHERSAGAA